jgi:adenylylsulfate kinase
MSDLFYQSFQVCFEQRINKLGFKPKVFWLTGLSGSGKSTLANHLNSYFFENNIQAYILDGDNIRLGLNKDLGFEEHHRKENLRRIAEVAKLMLDAGLVCICAFVSPFEADRQMVKSIIGTENMQLIYVDCSIAACKHRDVKGLYAKAEKGEIKNFTGIDSPYEIPSQPDFVVNTESQSIAISQNKVLQFALQALSLHHE